MPQKKNKRKQIKAELRALGLPPGMFAEAIDKAIRNSWGETEFDLAIRRTIKRSNLFPGMFERGNLRFGEFAGGARSVGQAITAWRQMQSAYTEAGERTGWGAVTKKDIGAFLRGNVSPDEVAQKMEILVQANATEETRNQYNAVFSAAGLPTLDRKNWRKFVGGTAEKKFYDAIEAAQILGTGLNVGGTQGALRLAQSLGAGGQLTPNLGQILSRAQQIQTDILPELEREGFTLEDLLGFLETGSGPRGIGRRIEQLTAQRRARGQARPGTQTQQGPAGGLSLFPDEQAQSAR